jgi:hypothetical protein
MMRTIVGVSILAFQLVMIVYARFVPSRYFCWAPYDVQTEYWITTVVNGRKLTESEIRGRYRRAQHGTDNRSPQHVMDILQGYEESYGRNDHAQVTMRYRVNGKEEQVWRLVSR